MKIKFILLFLCIYTYSFCQNRIKIDFNNTTSGDYDLMINDILTNNGYDSFIDYQPEKSNHYYDLLIKYNTTSHDNYDELKSFSLALYDSTGNRLNEITKNISFFNVKINEYKKISEGLNSLLEKRLKYKKNDSYKKVKYFNITFNIHKLDSATYSIVAKGAGSESLADVEDAFLTKATEYLSDFDYYFKNNKYKYHAPGPYSFVPHTGYIVIGIIKGNSTNNNHIMKLKEKPIEFIKEFEEEDI
ncbi:MAG: hypothetical protein LBP67_01270 [Bacteroidales bacterium]|jgi:hypothetical protein|nr:hypothetical protein [Bacteroidales bacterium]